MSRAAPVLPLLQRIPLAAGCALVVGATSGACQPCRAVDAKPIDLECAAASTFIGELHFTDPATFRSFLTDRCLGAGSADAADAIVGSVDFASDAVVVARGARAGAARCIERRSVDGVASCTDGLRVVFDDQVSNEPACGGTWTVALSLPRSELRAALGEDADTTAERF